LAGGTNSSIVSETNSIGVTKSLNPSTIRPSRRNPRACSSIHVPYNHNMAPFSFMRLVPCLKCKSKWVPETILASVEPSVVLGIRGKSIYLSINLIIYLMIMSLSVLSIGKGELLEARVCRSRRTGTSETDAVKISEALPFLEFDVQRQMMLKLKILGMNAAFGYTSRIQIGSNMIIAVASCTAVYLEALPNPPPLLIAKAIKDGRMEHDQRLKQLQKNIQELCELKVALEKSRHSDNINNEEEKRTGYYNNNNYYYSFN
jgi:hypothetical protein